MAIDITVPDNEADTIITLTISGNRLVSICNAVQALMHETGKIGFPAYREIDEVVERVRDQLSAQRMERQFPGWIEDQRRIREIVR
jgi:hypothetical protein